MPAQGDQREGEDSWNAEEQEARTEPAQGVTSAVSRGKPMTSDRQDGMYASDKPPSRVHPALFDAIMFPSLLAQGDANEYRTSAVHAAKSLVSPVAE